MSEKLKEIIENMPKDILINSFETVYEDSIKKDLEIERLNSIIKEVREYIEDKWEMELKDSMEDFLDHDERIERKQIKHILDILKGVDKE